MILPFADWDDHTFDLAIERYTVGLDEAGIATLDRSASRDALDEFESMLALIHLAHLPKLESPPVDLVDRIEREGRLRVEAITAPAARGTLLPFGSPLFAVGGWLVAAALLLTFALIGGGTGDDPLVRREVLLAQAGDLLQIDWTTTDDPAAAEAGGDVVWSSSMQEGYMRFRGLTPNDPADTQYQLWIFDPTRADWEAKPVDGGVFDVPSSGEVIVPIDAKLAVNETALFAVTIEVPGGVVVSERERLVLTAAL